MCRLLQKAMGLSGASGNWKKFGTRSARTSVRQSGKRSGIEGFGGLGKTQLAVEYAHEYRDRYENGVYWLTADEDMSVQF